MLQPRPKRGTTFVGQFARTNAALEHILDVRKVVRFLIKEDWGFANTLLARANRVSGDMRLESRPSHFLNELPHPGTQLNLVLTS